MGCCNGHGTKKVENHWFSATVSNDNKDKNNHSGPYAGQPLREKVNIWLGSLHAADFIHCLCDDSLYVHLSENLACIQVGKSEKHLIYIFFFLVIHQQWLLKSIFV